MRIRELRARLEDCRDTDEVFARISLDFLDGHPELVADFNVIWDGDRHVLDMSVRLGDIALQFDEDVPCDGCPLDRADGWLFEHTDIDSLIEEFCDRPDNYYRCCFLPEEPSDDDAVNSNVVNDEGEVSIPF